VILIKTRLEICLFVLQNEWQSNILDRLYQIMFKIIIGYHKLIFEVPLSPLSLVPPLENCAVCPQQ
jgi:hypothetical protein